MSVGALAGVNVVELAGQGPGSFAAMMLADHGAEVIRVDPPPGRQPPGAANPINRGRQSVQLDLKSDQGRRELLSLLDTADVLIDPFRPGVLERLGLVPDELQARCPRLVIGRMSGWGQTGPDSGAAGHDINFISVSGVLGTIGTVDSGPVIPLMYLGDFGGGGMVLAFGVLAALIERSTSGRGQLIDASMMDGSNLLTVALRGLAARGAWAEQRGVNFLDSGSHYYQTYRTADGGYMAVGAIEPQFYQRFLACLGIADGELGEQNDPAGWPAAKQRIADIFAGRTRLEWERIFEGQDACVTPVLGLDESSDHRQMRARNAIVDVAGVAQPAPAPRFSRTPAPALSAPPVPGQHNDRIRSDPS
ncbi:CaiB/BaiF CoA transferase family protein [Nakamurella lactea]|uniref:CaiB/BaiF CoA transferase family protein n=1 Tax=Nakamurella lactea TaxID=459515 RepID=UPI00055A7E22|nr:CaiB/BaiF CoA-transferase family protein [Nakamurella lactea]